MTEPFNIPRLGLRRPAQVARCCAAGPPLGIRSDGSAAACSTLAEGVPTMTAHLPDDPAYAFCPVTATSDGEPPQIRIVVEKILPSASLPRWSP